jgi:hypothetical protein
MSPYLETGLQYTEDCAEIETPCSVEQGFRLHGKISSCCYILGLYLSVQTTFTTCYMCDIPCVVVPVVCTFLASELPRFFKKLLSFHAEITIFSKMIIAAFIYVKHFV